MHYESDCVCIRDFCKHWLSPRSFLFSNSSLGEESSINLTSKMFLFNQEKPEAASLLSWFIFSTVNPFLFYQIDNLCIFSLVSSGHGPTSRWFHKVTVYPLVLAIYSSWFPPNRWLCPSVNWILDLGIKREGWYQKNQREQYLSSHLPQDLIHRSLFVDSCIVFDVVCYGTFDESARLRVTFCLRMSGGPG